MDEVELRAMQQAEAARRTKSWGGAALLAGGIVLTVVGFVFGIGREGDAATTAGVVAGVGFAGALCGLALIWMYRRGSASGQLTGATTERERLQKQRAQQLVLFPTLLVVFLGQAIGAVDAIIQGQAEWRHYLQIFVPVLYGWLIPAIVMGWHGGGPQYRKYLNDELSQSMRARAMIMAFVVLMGGATLALGLGLWRLELGVAALPFVLAIGGATAGLRFAWLDREAGRG